MSSHTENHMPTEDDRPIAQSAPAVDAKRSWSAPTITTFTVASDTQGAVDDGADAFNNLSEPV
jgi:hypothetical protein